MRSSTRESDSHFLLTVQAGAADQSGNHPHGSMLHRAMLLVFVMAALVAVPVQAKSQTLVSSEDPPATTEITPSGKLDIAYVRPAERTKVNNYGFDAFGPHPIAGAAFTAGINQWTNSPREWGPGAKGFGERFGSNFAIATIGTSTRYWLAEAFQEDTLYYRCECSGPFPRLRHAVISTLTGRRGEDGHGVFSFSALVAPYAGSMIAPHAWYPDRSDAKDAFRMGNYSLLSYLGGNISLEFLYSGPHALISRMHLNSAHSSTIQGPSQ